MPHELVCLQEKSKELVDPSAIRVRGDNCTAGSKRLDKA